MPALDYGPYAFGIGHGQHVLKWQTHYRLDDEQIAQGLGSTVSERFADLLDIAASIYVSDRLSPRRKSGARRDGEWWSRRLSVEIGVRDLGFWQQDEIHTVLTSLLDWLTDDRWLLKFIGHPVQRRRSETQARLFSDDLAAPTQVGLFSGGMDSLLGAERDLREGNGEIVLAAAGSHGRLIGKQLQLARGLKELGPRRLRVVDVPVSLTQSGKALLGTRTEESQRSRGFVFLSLGAAVADAAGVHELRLYENGPGALNLPLTAGQRGSMNTRAARPETLTRMSELISAMQERAFRVWNPEFWRTKREMCENARPVIHPLMIESVSCDSGLTRRVRDTPLCGTCTSCLLRRQALLASDLVVIDRADLERMRGDALSAPLGHANPMVLAMLNQAAQIAEALDRPEPWQALVGLYPELATARRALDVGQDALPDLLARYVDDWRTVPRSLVRQFLGSSRDASLDRAAA